MNQDEQGDEFRSGPGLDATQAADLRYRLDVALNRVRVLERERNEGKRETDARDNDDAGGARTTIVGDLDDLVDNYRSIDRERIHWYRTLCRLEAVVDLVRPGLADEPASLRALVAALDAARWAADGAAQ